MRKAFFILVLLALAFFTSKSARAATILYEDFEDSDGFITGTGPATYWDIAPLGGTASLPSNFVTGGNQSGNIFYGSRGKGGPSDPAPTMTVNLPDLTSYSSLEMTVSLAAPDCTVSTCWEITHRDRLVIYVDSVEVDRFRPQSRASALISEYGSGTLHYQFANFNYVVSNTASSITFEFASSSSTEVVGIDSLIISGELQGPTYKDECKNGGWELFSNPTFKNQGECVSYLESNEKAGKRN